MIWFWELCWTVTTNARASTHQSNSLWSHYQHDTVNDHNRVQHPSTLLRVSNSKVHASFLKTKRHEEEEKLLFSHHSSLKQQPADL